MRLNFLGLLILVAIVGVAVGGAYGAGIVMGKGTAPAATQAQGAAGDAGAAGAAGASRAGGNSFGSGGSGISGTVQKIDGNTLTITTQSGGSTQVTLSDNTSIRKTTEASRNELAQDVAVVILGQQGSGGNLAASSIQIVAADGATPGQQPVQQPRSKPQSAPTSAP